MLHRVKILEEFEVQRVEFCRRYFLFSLPTMSFMLPSEIREGFNGQHHLFSNTLTTAILSTCSLTESWILDVKANEVPLKINTTKIKVVSLAVLRVSINLYI